MLGSVEVHNYNSCCQFCILSLTSGCGVVLMSCLQQKPSWAPNAVMLLSKIWNHARAQKPVATALLSKVQALLLVAPMLCPLPEVSNPTGVMLHTRMRPSLPALLTRSLA